jgi:formylglycine-generating enzyme required for sulfatase activity/predicted Ser/Thr protein kinase
VKPGSSADQPAIPEPESPTIERTLPQVLPSAGPETLGSAQTMPGGASTDPTPRPAPAIAERLGRYILLERLGQGGMGVVWAAYDPELDRRVAIKLLRVSPALGLEAQKRLLREAQAMAKLSHPNVLAVHDVGVVDGNVFVAMELVKGQTMREWMRGTTPRPLRDVLDVFIQAANGLQAAHEIGMVHRDFKPENVMIREDGRVLVMDFGLARSEAIMETDGRVVLTPEMRAQSNLTHTGALLGTPAYMSPEQFASARVDTRSDQFSFCVTLFEVLFGQHPFPATTVMEQAMTIAAGRPAMPARSRPVPSWIRRIVLRGMMRDPANRWPSMAGLRVALERRNERRIFLVIVAAAVAAVAAVYITTVIRSTMAQQAEVAALLSRAAVAMDDARMTAHGVRNAHGRALSFYEQGMVKEAEALFYLANTDGDRANALFRTSITEMTKAFNIDPSDSNPRRLLVGALYEHAEFMESRNQFAAADEIFERLKIYDIHREQEPRWTAPATVRIRTEPPGATTTLERYEPDPNRRRIPTVLRIIDNMEPREVSIAPGSYRLIFELPGHETVYYPLSVTRGEQLNVAVSMPRKATLPPGFVYIPAGRFLIGSFDLEPIRSFFAADPGRPVETGAYLIARHETTNAEYIEFLEALTPELRAARLGPEVARWEGGLGLTQLDDGVWQFELKIGEEVQTVRRGERVRLPGDLAVDWLNLPVAGLTWSEADAYVNWLDRGGKRPGARLCSEREWERAARGADDRQFPHGDNLSIGDANFGTQQAGVELAPSVIGSYPISESPFGVMDMAGSVVEWVSSHDDSANKVTRGGGYLFDKSSAAVTNRAPLDPNLRVVKAGVRVCMAVPPPSL